MNVPFTNSPTLIRTHPGYRMPTIRAGLAVDPAGVILREIFTGKPITRRDRLPREDLAQNARNATPNAPIGCPSLWRGFGTS